MLGDLDRVRALMRRDNLDALLVVSRDNVYYLGDFSTLDPNDESALILSANDEPTLLQSKSDENVIPKDCWVKDRKFFGRFYVEGAANSEGDFRNLAEGVCAIIKAKHLKQIGIEDKSIPFELYQTLRKSLPDCDFRMASSLLEELRTIKSDIEIDRLRRAARMWEDSVISVYGQISEGMSESAVANALKAAVASRGGDCIWVEMGGLVGFPTLPSENKLRRGDILHIDMGATCNGYGTDMARDAVLGEPNDRQRKVNKALTYAQKKAVESIRAGVKASDVFKIGQQAVRDAGFPQYWRHNIGHGIGLRCHENPVLTPTSQIELRPGMVINIEIPYYIKDFAAFNVESTMAVTKDGSELLSTLDRDLYVL
ncbi:MAG: M24 family metallopeptidase [Candidatus Bathyarchaeia archaeon]